MTPRLAELQLFRLQQDSKYVAVSTDQTDMSSKVKEKKRKPVPGVNSEESPAKRQKGTTQNLKKPDNSDKNQLKSSVVVDEKEHSEAQVSKPERENDVETKALSITKSRHYNDKCTAFISNLNLKASSAFQPPLFVVMWSINIKAAETLLCNYWLANKGLYRLHLKICVISSVMLVESVMCEYWRTSSPAIQG